MANSVGRRGFLKPTGGVLGGAVADTRSPEERLLPKALSGVKTAKVGAFRHQILQGKSGCYHAREFCCIGSLAIQNMNPAKQQDTLQITEKNGINGIAVDTVQLDLIKQCDKDRGGSVQTVCGVRQDRGEWKNHDWTSFKTAIDQEVDQGATSLFTHGGFSDRRVESVKLERLEILGKAVEYIRSLGNPVGSGSHDIRVPIEFDKLGIEPDFYFKTSHLDGYWPATLPELRNKFSGDREQSDHRDGYHDTMFEFWPGSSHEFMKGETPPWIASKTLAARSIKPDSALKFVFEGGAGFAALRMFDFDVEEDLKTTHKVLNDLGDRARPWRS